MRLTDFATLVALAYHLVYVFNRPDSSHLLLALFFGSAYIFTDKEPP